MIARLLSALPLFTLTLCLAACGGGGGGGSSPAAGNPATGGGGSGSGGTAMPATNWVRNSFAPSSTYKNWCEFPRQGASPLTGQPYGDRQGNALHEMFWLRSWSNELYLWYDEIIDRDPRGFSDPLVYFDSLRTLAVTPTGRDKDQFHFAELTSSFEQESIAGEVFGFGMHVTMDSFDPPRNLWVDYVEPGSEADQAGIRRGTRILEIDQVDIVHNTNEFQLFDALSKLFPDVENFLYTFLVQHPGESGVVNLGLLSGRVSTSSVLTYETLPSSTGPVGYISFNNHNATAEAELVEAFDALAREDISDLVLDVRYNGGGILAVASQAAYMIAGESATVNRVFERTVFNDKIGSTDPFTGQPLDPIPFIDSTAGFSLVPGLPLPGLDLRRVFILTGPGTCSASESIINSLRGIGIEVIQIGTTTCGKPYGFFPEDNCGITYFTIQFRGENDIGFGDYADGFSPVNTISSRGVSLPGCSVTDDRLHALGDPAEAMLSAALTYRENGSCPAPPSMSSFSLSSTAPVAGAPGNAVSANNRLETWGSFSSRNRIHMKPGQSRRL